MSTTMAIPFGSATPWLPSAKWGRARSLAEESDTTPLALDPTGPAIRNAVLQFSEAFETLHDEGIVRVVRAGTPGSEAIISGMSAFGRVLVYSFGQISRVDPAHANPLTVFDRIQGELAVTQKELLAATNIKHRTYYSWKKPSTPRPRPSSLGRLWHLADALVDLNESLERPIAAWLHSSPERMAAFKEGRFEDLVDLAVDMTKSDDSARTATTSRPLGVASDIGVPVVKTGKPNMTVVKRGRQVDDR